MKAPLNCLESAVRRLLIWGVVALSAPAQMPKTEPTSLCSMEGQVVDAATGAPVRRARLTLWRDSVLNTSLEIPTATSDATGSFIFRDLQPGAYELVGDARGYVSLTTYTARQARRAGTLFSLTPGQRLTGIVLRLTRNSAVSGRIVDEDGDPISSVEVQLLRFSYRSGKKVLVEASIKASTDDRGRYRIWGEGPGKYYLSAFHPWAQSTQDARYVPTYYPGTIDEAAAAPIDMAPGAELENINLALSKVRTARVRGRVLDVGAGAVVMRREGIVSGDQSGSASVSVGPDGQFEFRGVRPGAYTLLAHTDDVERPASALRSVTVGAADLDGLTISVLPATLVTGHVSVDGESQADFSNTRIELRAYPDPEAWWSPGAGTVLKNGTTRIAGVIPGRYKVIVPDTPDGFYLKAVRLGGRDLPGQVLDVTAGGPAQIEVLLSPKPASVTGTVSLADSDEPAVQATVVLIPQEKERRNDPLAFLRSMTDESGKFTIRNIVPGEYKAFAWEDVEYGIYMDPDFIRPIDGKGVAVTLPESARISVKLIAIAPAAGL